MLNRPTRSGSLEKGTKPVKLSVCPRLPHRCYCGHSASSTENPVGTSTPALSGWVHVVFCGSRQKLEYMTRRSHSTQPDLFADPFRERSPPIARAHFQLLGGRFQFESNSRQLLRLADLAYADLPRHRLSTRAPRLRVGLLLTSGYR